MLNVFREGARTWGIKLFIWLVAATFVGSAFVFWGHGLSSGEEAVVTIGERKISRQRYLERVRQLENMFRRQFQGRMDRDLMQALNVPRLAINSLVESALQVDAAKEAGLAVSDIELRATIESMGEFRGPTGLFDHNRYIETLSRNGLTPKVYEDSLKTDILISKLKYLVKKGVYVSEAELRSQYLFENAPVVIAYSKVSAEKYKPKVKIAQQEISEWYEKHGSEFTEPERRKFRLMKVATKVFEDKSNPSLKELEEYYQANISQFEIKEQVHARHILTQLSSSASDKEVEKARAKITKARARVMSGESFEKVAKEMSDGPSAANGGDLGKFGRGDMVSDFEKVVFDMKPGTVSDIFRTEFGFHIVKKLAHIKRNVPPFEEVKKKVEKIVRKRNAQQEAWDFMEKLRSGINPKSFASVADTNPDVKINDYSVSKGAPASGLAGVAAIENTVFGLGVKEISEVIDMPEGFGIVIVDSVEPQHIPPLDKVKERVEERFRFVKAMKMAEETAKRIKESVNQRADIKSAAKAEGLSVTITKPFTRSSISGRKNGAETGMMREAFDLADGKAATAPEQDGYVVLTVASRPPVDEKDMSEKIESLRGKILQRKQTEIYSSYLANLRKQAEKSGKIKIKAGLAQATL